MQGRTGYLQWRERLKSSHAATVVGLMEQAGYDAAACEKVKRWILKKDIKTDPENQVCWRCTNAPVCTHTVACPTSPGSGCCCPAVQSKL
jgi:hypothetical protein